MSFILTIRGAINNNVPNLSFNSKLKNQTSCHDGLFFVFLLVLKERPLQV